jgi:bifunctional UDP-N-acetylglucosamine pyrophosphorylase/glucosamine-1-phosphate N-acetyltransferase
MARSTAETGAGLTFVVLAAGQGTRMNSDRPKVMHPLGGVPMLWHALHLARGMDPDRVVVVAGHGGAEVAASVAAFDEGFAVVEQAERLGTAHAVRQAAGHLRDGVAVVLYGDTPFVRAETVAAMLAAQARHAVVVLGFQAADPGRYGRLIAEGEDLHRIVEYKDASPEERAITLCNSGVVCADARLLADLVAAVGNANASGEYYLTDIVEIARARGLSAGVVTCPEAETMGVNTRAELAVAEGIFQTRMRAAALDDGVTLTDPASTYFAPDTVIGRDAVIGPGVIFGPGVTIESGAEIKGFCHLEGCHVAKGATVGPFARLRPGAELAEDVHVGNFVEIKNSLLAEGVKVGHLTYLGDAEVGEHSNIGAGTVTCNYDGVMKHRTTIGARAFIGSDTMLVAPVTVGDGAMTASGSVITLDVPPDALAVARARQVNKPGFVARLVARLKAAKAAKKGP